MSGAICASPRRLYRVVERCPSCRTRRRIVVADGGWWGLTMTCCACGFSWTTEEALRAGKRQRAKDAARAREEWKAAKPWSAWTPEL